MADIDDDDHPPPPPGLPDPFLFEPGALLIAQKLPPKLFFGPLAAVVPDGQVRYIIKQRGQTGAVCPACQFTWTTWKGEETRDKLFGGDLNLKAGKFNCQASACNTDPVPCSTCIVCKDDPQLQAAIKHNCVGTGMIDVPIKPGTTCAHCDFYSNVFCKCPICNTIKHAKTFFLIANYVPSAVQGGLGTWEDYPRNVIDANKYAVSKRTTYEKSVQKGQAADRVRNLIFNHAPPETAMALQKIALDGEDGVKFIAELERNSPGVLLALGASQDLLNLVNAEIEKVITQSSFRVNQYFLTRSEDKLQFLVRKIKDNRIGSLVSNMINTVRRTIAVREQTVEQQQALIEVAQENAARLSIIEGGAIINAPVPSIATEEINRERLGSLDATLDPQEHLVLEKGSKETAIDAIQNFSASLDAREREYYHHTGDSSQKVLTKKRKRENVESTTQILTALNNVTIDQSTKFLCENFLHFNNNESTPSKLCKFNNVLKTHNEMFTTSENNIPLFTMCDGTNGYDSFDEL